MKKRRILVTSALPYANGPIHLGHLVEYIQTDIWVRFQKACGHEVYYFCADDTHGTPVMIAARNAATEPEQLVERVHAEHLRDLSAFDVDFDNYYTTNSPENRELACGIYENSKAAGHIARRDVAQLYCEHDQMFLPDRFVKGECPSCGAADQYGDSCDNCSATYAPRDLKNAACSICGNAPVERNSEHLFFKLSDFQKFLEDWLAEPGHVDDGVRKKMNEWLQSGLRDWDISRDGPYFGFEIPGEENKYFYVWLDAPIGYMASSKNYFEKTGQKKLFDEFWNAEVSAKKNTEVYHFIGKDIIYFHTLFWPSLLKVGGYRRPSAVFVHGFLTVNGEKMSKSRGTFVRAETFLKHIEPGALRYYYAARLGSGLDDLDLATTDFVQRYNADIVGNLVNIFSRLGSGIAKKLEHRLSEKISKQGKSLHTDVLKLADEIRNHYENREYHRVIRTIASAGHAINQFINEREPWNSIKTDVEATRQTVTDAFQSGRILIGCIKPILPRVAQELETFLQIEPVDFTNIKEQLPSGHVIRAYKHIVQRLTEAQFEDMFAEEQKAIEAGHSAGAKSGSQKATGKKAQAVSGKSSAGDKKSKRAAEHHAATQQTAVPDSDAEDAAGIITIEDLSRVELKVGRIVSAGLVEGADRLLAIQLDVGEERPRSVIAGIRSAYKPEDLTDLMVVAVTNLKPRKMKFGLSEAMLLAAGEGDVLTLMTPHREAHPGDRLR